MVYKGEKIQGTHCKEALENMKIKEYGYVNECIFIYKRTQKRNRSYTFKSLELFCSQDINEKSLKRLIKKSKKAGIKGNGIVQVINVKTNEVLSCYDYRDETKEELDERTCTYKNTSSYTTDRLYKQ
jgi:hypothetical protein